MPLTSRPSQISSAPMLIIAAMFAAGIAVAAYVPLGSAIPTIVCGVLAVIAFATAGKWYATLLVSFAFSVAGAVVYQVHEASVTPDRIRSIYDSGQIASGEPVEITGTITGNSETSVEGFFIRLDVDSIAYKQQVRYALGTVRLFATMTSPDIAADYEQLDLKLGTRIRIYCELLRDDGYRNPGVLSRKTSLEWQDLDATGTIKSPLLVENLGQKCFGIASFVFGIREHLIEKFRELFSPQVAGVMIASLLGNKHFLDKPTADIFREGGTFHVLVISGLHITFIGGLVALLVGSFTRRRTVRFAVACSFLWLYTIAVGAEVPVVRASLMFTILWFSHVIHRTGSLANALGTCGLILLVWRPNDLFTPSFQLTFVSVAAIVIAGFPLIKTLRSIGEWVPSSNQPFPASVPAWLQRFCETLYWNPNRWEIDAVRNVWSAKLFKSPFLKVEERLLFQRIAAHVFEGVLISIIVQIAMLPLVVHYFHRVTPVSILTNLWTGLLLALESFSSLFAVVFSLFSESLALTFVRLTELFHWLLISVPSQVSDVGWLSFRVPIHAGREPLLYGFYFLLVTFLALAIYMWNPFTLPSQRNGVRLSSKILLPAVLGILAFGSIVIFHPFSEPQPDGRLHVEFLDVGQGDSVFITFPNGETMLVDGGGRTSYRDEDDDVFEPDLPRIGEMVVSEFLWEKGYSRIDYLVATHADADHIQGLADAARNFTIGQAWLSRLNTDDPDQAELESVLKSKRIPVNVIARGERFNIGGAFVEVLNPTASVIDEMSENNRSIVLRITTGSRSFLLTGDIERVAEDAILSNGGTVRADVIKVPHHGSRTSSTSEFINAVRPEYAVITVGQRSPFGHPNKEVVERWRSAGAVVLTTGRSGTVTFATDGRDLTVSTFIRNSE